MVRAAVKFKLQQGVWAIVAASFDPKVDGLSALTVECFHVYVNAFLHWWRDYFTPTVQRGAFRRNTVGALKIDFRFAPFVCIKIGV